MCNLDAMVEEHASNKLELTGQLIDGFVCKVGKAIQAKFGRSRNMPPVRLFVPYAILHHIFNITVGYGGKLTNDNKMMSVTKETFENASNVFAPARFSGTNFLKKRHLEKMKENGRSIFKYSGRVAVVVGKSTSLLFEYNMKHQRLTTTFYIQVQQRRFLIGFAPAGTHKQNVNTIYIIIVQGFLHYCVCELLNMLKPLRDGPLEK